MSAFGKGQQFLKLGWEEMHHANRGVHPVASLNTSYFMPKELHLADNKEI